MMFIDCAYSKVKELEQGGHLNFFYVQTSNSKPSWFNHVDYNWDTVHPGWDLVNRYKGMTSVINYIKRSPAEREQDYIKSYNQILETRTTAIMDEWATINKLAAGRVIVLLCWEPEGFCHRYLLAKFLDKANDYYPVIPDNGFEKDLISWDKTYGDG
jgi:hypothetical protein